GSTAMRKFLQEMAAYRTATADTGSNLVVDVEESPSPTPATGSAPSLEGAKGRKRTPPAPGVGAPPRLLGVVLGVRCAVHRAQPVVQNSAVVPPKPAPPPVEKPVPLPPPPVEKPVAAPPPPVEKPPAAEVSARVAISSDPDGAAVIVGGK